MANITVANPTLLISGTGRPLVASAFALVICIAMYNGLVAISIGTGNQSGTGEKFGVYLVAAFFCGFSERFAKDLLERAERTPREPQRSELVR